MNAHTPVLTPLALEHADLVRALHARDFATKAELCERLGRDPSNLNKTLKRLAAEGLVDFDATTLTAAGANAVRDLDALAGMGASATFAAAGFVELSPFEIANDPLNPRKHFDEGAIGELADSIARDGLLENLVVRELQAGDTVHRLVAGERRWRAMCKLIADGRWDADQRVACKVIAIDDAGHRRVALVENLQRKDLRPIDEATALKELMAVTGVGTAEVAKEIGFTQRFVQQRLQLLDLPVIKQVELQEGKLSIEAARQWLAARPDKLELSPEDELVVLEIGWGIAAKSNGQWTSIPCDYTAPQKFKRETLVHYSEMYDGRVEVRLNAKAYGHLRSVSGSDDSLVRNLLEPHVKRARTAALAGNPLSADYDSKAFQKVDVLFKEKRNVTTWLNDPKPDPAVLTERARQRQAQANAPEPEWRVQQREREAAQKAQEAKGKEALPIAQDYLADFTKVTAAAATAAEIIGISHPLPWKWFKEADGGVEGIQDANDDWVSLDGYGDGESASAMVVLAIVNGFFGHESRIEIEPEEPDDEDDQDDEAAQ